jgi:hypothetical protein
LSLLPLRCKIISRKHYIFDITVMKFSVTECMPIKLNYTHWTQRSVTSPIQVVNSLRYTRGYIAFTHIVPGLNLFQMNSENIFYHLKTVIQANSTYFLTIYSIL